MRRRKPLSVRITLVGSRPDLPPGGFHPYRDMPEEEREQAFVRSLAEILREQRLGSPVREALAEELEGRSETT